MSVKNSHSVEFFRELLSISEDAFILCLHRLCHLPDRKSVLNALRLFECDGATQNFLYNTASHLNGETHYTHLFAQALNANTIDKRCGPSTILSVDQQSIFDKVIQLAQAAPDPVAVLDSFLIECIAQTRDPAAFKSLLDAGANPGACGYSNRLNRFVEESAVLALKWDNAPAFLILMQETPSRPLGDLAAVLVKNLDGSKRQGENLTDTVAGMIAQEGQYDGLAVLRRIESLNQNLTIKEKLEVRASVLISYLLHVALLNREWDPLVVGYLMGDDRAHRAMPLQDAGVNFEQWACMSSVVTGDLLSIALQTHCWPVLQALKEPLRQTCGPDTTYTLGSIREQLSDQKKLSSRAVSLMLHPIKDQHAMHRDNFEKTLDLMGQLDLLKIEHMDLTHETPILHCIAKYIGVDRPWVLMRMLEAGFSPQIKDTQGRLASDALTAPADVNQWNSLITSFHARQAALRALSDINAAAVPVKGLL